MQVKIIDPQEDIVKDEITRAVILDLASRAKRGIKKYKIGRAHV